MAGRSARVGKAAQEMGSLSGAECGQTRGPEHAQGQRGNIFDRRLAAIAAGVAVALLVLARYFVDRAGPTGWSWPVLMVCVLVAGAAGRALLGHRSVSEEQDGRPSTGVRAAVWLVLLGAATVPHLHGLHVGFLADDFGLLRAARLASGPLDAARLAPLQIFHRPVSQLVWWLGLDLWNGSPLGYHLFSVALHAVNTALVYLLARRYIGSVYGGAMAALLFAVHPVHTEATLWAAAQPDLLCTAFSLSSMWCVEQYLAAPRGRRRQLALAGALAAFLLALWSKETAVALPGVVFLRLVLESRDRRWVRALGVSAAYALPLGVYLAVRFLVLGENWLGAHGTKLIFWTAALPSTPLMLTGEYFFPVHRELFRSLLSPYLWVAAVAVMAVGLLWWIRSLEFVSSRRLALYAGYVLLPAVPLSMAGLTIGVDMVNTRYAYLPSVGFALLFGEICARRSGSRRRSALVGVATILVAAALSIWYVVPWRQAALLRNDVLAASVRVVATLPDSPPPSTVFVQGVPLRHLGAPVFEACFGIALSPLLERRVSIQEIAPTWAALSVMSASDLLPGEYLVSWNDESEDMVIERAGSHRVSEPMAGGPR